MGADHTHRPDLSRVKLDADKSAKTVCIVCGIPMTVDYVPAGGAKAGGKV